MKHLLLITALSSAPVFAADICAKLPTGESNRAVYQTLRETIRQSATHEQPSEPKRTAADPETVRAAQVALCRASHIDAGVGGYGYLVQSQSIAYAVLRQQPDADQQFADLFRSSRHTATKIYALAGLAASKNPAAAAQYRRLRAQINPEENVGFAWTDVVDGRSVGDMLQWIDSGKFDEAVLSSEFCRRSGLCGEKPRQSGAH
ncbi:hypothetical protein H9Q10_09995 [Eikenella sp. S3360]|uniref:Uncharacterized protein n=1 Tax=Eikenella glucosivorans TaxID=2766967 RepID=A0ABS0NCF3_9NEIS|nr:hypothetical protein [Eikenella glucosivorans]MBH5329992.1 hypothetical protein [Eikenella glucosivorans]